MAMQVGGQAEGEPMSEINTTPLIDVMLVLLIMLIVTLPPTRHAVKLDTPLPPPPDAPPPDPNTPDPIRIYVDYDGTFYWNGAPIDPIKLEADLKVESRRDPQAQVHIEPHPLASYGAVAHVMATAQREGMTSLGVLGGV